MTVADPGTWTAGQCEQVFHNAVKAGDAKAVDAVLHLLAIRDPHRAQRLYDDLKTAVRIASAVHADAEPNTEATR